MCSAKHMKALVSEKTAWRKHRCVILYFGPTQYSKFEKAILAQGGRPIPGEGSWGNNGVSRRLSGGRNVRNGVHSERQCGDKFRVLGTTRDKFRDAPQGAFHKLRT
jgi:hypothetical protein